MRNERSNETTDEALEPHQEVHKMGDESESLIDQEKLAPTEVATLGGEFEVTPTNDKDEFLVEVNPEDEPEFGIFTQLFFGESEDEVVERLRLAKIPEDQARKVFTELIENFSGTGEHLANDDYIEIVSKIYNQAELFDKAYAGFHQFILHNHQIENGDAEQRELTLDLIQTYFPSLDGFNPGNDDSIEDSMDDLEDDESTPDSSKDVHGPDDFRTSE